MHRSHSILPAAFTLLSACSQFSLSHTIRKQGGDLPKTTQSGAAARLNTLQVNLAESTINMSRMEDGHILYKGLNNEEAKDGEEKDNEE